MLKTPVEIPQIKLIYKHQATEYQDVRITYSRKAYECFLESWDIDTIGFVEEFKILLLNRSNMVLGIYALSTGTTSKALASIKLVFAAAILANAEAIILCHNHPSGYLKPSQQDIYLTNKFIEAGKLLEINVIDHLIITGSDCFSLNENRLCSF